MAKKKNESQIDIDKNIKVCKMFLAIFSLKNYIFLFFLLIW